MIVFQGVISTEDVLELGTSKRGVLSPTMLFNILIDKIACWPFLGDTQVIIKLMIFLYNVVVCASRLSITATVSIV